MTEAKSFPLPSDLTVVPGTEGAQAVPSQLPIGGGVLPSGVSDASSCTGWGWKSSVVSVHAASSPPPNNSPRHAKLKMLRE